MNDRPLLKLTGIGKRFGGVVALHGVEFELRPGEVHAIVGENGAGKSTLIRIITGALNADAGSIEIAGEPVAELTPARAQELGVAAIYQQPALFPDLTVAENIDLRLGRLSPFRFIDHAARRRRADELLRDVGAEFPSCRFVRDLSMPQQQLVEIACAVGRGARILILDEPTASLSEREVEKLFQTIRRFRSADVGLIYISHRLEELPLVADRVSVLRDGRHVGTHAMRDVDREKLIRLMVGRTVETIFPKRDVRIGEVVLETRSLGSAINGTCDVNLTVRAGEIVGVGGLVGAGRSELAHILFGLTPADAGDIRLNGRPISIRDPAAAVAAGIAYVPEDRRRHGVVLDMSVVENMTLSILRELSRGTLIDSSRERAIAADFVQRLGVKVAGFDAPAGTMSGGNQQKVALARWLATKPKLLILDEPTQGIDVGAKADIHRLIGELAAGGMAILLISSEIPELLGMADRIVVMRAGRITGTLDRAAATPEKLLALAMHDVESEAIR